MSRQNDMAERYAELKLNQDQISEIEELFRQSRQSAERI